MKEGSQVKKDSQVKKNSQVRESFDLALKNFGMENGYLIPRPLYRLESLSQDNGQIANANEYTQ